MKKTQTTKTQNPNPENHKQTNQPFYFNNILSFLPKNKEWESSTEARGHKSFEHSFASHSRMRTVSSTEDYIPLG